MSIKLEAKNSQCYCDINIDEFVKTSQAVQDALVNASIEVKGALYTMVLSEVPMLRIRYTRNVGHHRVR